MGRKPVVRTIYMDTLDLVAKMREELGELEKKLGTIKAHVREERFENKEFAGIGRFEEYMLAKGIRLGADGTVEGTEASIWDLLAEGGAAATKKK